MLIVLPDLLCVLFVVVAGKPDINPSINENLTYNNGGKKCNI